MAERIAPGDWVIRARQAHTDGFTFLVHLSVVDEVDRSDHLRAVLRLERPRDRARLCLETLIPRDDAHLGDLADILPGVAWWQRQAHDLFGIVFDGGDNRALVYRGVTEAPLRKEVLLEARLRTQWPGALEPGESGASPGRRRLAPPGVPDPAVLADPGATPAEIAASAMGARVRRTP